MTLIFLQYDEGGESGSGEDTTAEEKVITFLRATTKKVVSFLGEIG